MEKLPQKDCLEAAAEEPLISIVTVVLNGADTLEQAIKSVVCRKCKNFEYIIVDGGSLDGSIEIIRRYESQLACWSSRPDQGLYDAMNRAIPMTRGRWIYFLGADDHLLDGFDAAANRLRDEKTIYYGNVYRPVADRIYDGKFSAYKLASRNICHQSIFYPRCVWENYSYNLNYPVLADYELNLRCFADPGIRFQYLPVTVAVFTDEGGLSRTRRDVAFEKDKLPLIKSMFPGRVYILVYARSVVLKILDRTGIREVSVRVYHYLLKKTRVLLKDKH